MDVSLWLLLAGLAWNSAAGKPACMYGRSDWEIHRLAKSDNVMYCCSIVST